MNRWTRLYCFAIALLAINLSACGVGGGSDGGRDPGSSNPGSTTGGDTTGSTTGDGQTADNGTGGTGGTSGGGTSGGTGSGTGTGSSSGGGTTDPGGGGTGTDPGSAGTVSVNLPFDCPADPNSFEGCWVSEVCGADSESNTSYRAVLWFNAGTLRPLRVAWGTASCPPLDQPSVIPDAYQPQFMFGNSVATTTDGLTGILLDIDGGKTKTVAADLSQLKAYSVQRLCFHVGHLNPLQGIVAGSQRADTGPYPIDSTLCLQRHLKNP